MKILSHKLEELSNLRFSALVTVECDFCHNSFKKTRRTIEINIKRSSKHFFCNQRCKHDFVKQGTERKVYNCLECNKEVIRSDSQIEKSGHIFCSTKCSAIHANKIRYKDYVPKKKIRPLKQLRLNLVQNHKTKEIKLVLSKNSSIKCLCNCSQCNKEVLRTKYQLSKKKNKNGLVFCSRSCRMTHQNFNNPKKYSCRRSKAEVYLNNLIKIDFPDLLVLENDRTTLLSKREIDIYIPKYKLAIELNGPVHYLPIYGEDRLKKCQNTDMLKQQEIHNMGLAMLILDISRLCSKKKSEAFLIEYYNSHIKPILLNGSGAPSKAI